MSDHKKGVGEFIQRVGIDNLDNADILDVIEAAFTAGMEFGLREAIGDLPTDLPMFKEQAG